MALTKVTGQVINNSTGLVVGVTTVGGGLSATDGFFSGIVTFSQGVSIGGTLTYEDVTNIDSVLGPLWAFLFVSERPSIFSLIGGATILLAVLIQFYTLLKKSKKTISN